ncbi:ankyrin, partial [Apiospora saccharicola]
RAYALYNALILNPFKTAVKTRRGRRQFFLLRTAVEFGYELYRPDRPWDEEPNNLGELVTCLYYIYIYGLLYYTKELLEKGADVNAQGGYYGNALQAALSIGHEEVAQLLRASAIAPDFAHSPKAEKRDTDSDFDLPGRKRKKAIY